MNNNESQLFAFLMCLAKENKKSVVKPTSTRSDAEKAFKELDRIFKEDSKK